MHLHQSFPPIMSGLSGTPPFSQDSDVPDHLDRVGSSTVKRPGSSPIPTTVSDLKVSLLVEQRQREILSGKQRRVTLAGERVQRMEHATRCVCMCVYMCVCRCVCRCVCAFVCVGACACVCVRYNVNMHACAAVTMCALMCVYLMCVHLWLPIIRWGKLSPAHLDAAVTANALSTPLLTDVTDCAADLVLDHGATYPVNGTVNGLPEVLYGCPFNTAW